MTQMNGNGAQQTIQVNPAECARFALVFLSRADFKSNERQMFDLAEGLLKAIAEGRVTLAPTQQPQQTQEPLPDVQPVPLQ